MKEVLDIRLDEDWAQKEFGDGLGKPLPPAPGLPALTRLVILDGDDPRVETLKERILWYGKSKNRDVYSHVSINRRYRPSELSQAELLRLIFTRLVEIFGQEWGTEYDESNACPKCGYGRVQVSPLILDLGMLPKKADFVRTVAWDEWVVSERLANLIGSEGVSGCELRPVEDVRRRRKPLKWYQLVVTGRAGETVSPTGFGLDFFYGESNPVSFHTDYFAESVCREHGLSGHQILSEAYISRQAYDGSDLAVTSNRMGPKRDWVSPEPVLLISHRFYEMLQYHKIKGYKVERAHLV